MGTFRCALHGRDCRGFGCAAIDSFARPGSLTCDRNAWITAPRLPPAPASICACVQVASSKAPATIVVRSCAEILTSPKPWVGRRRARCFLFAAALRVSSAAGCPQNRHCCEGNETRGIRDSFPCQTTFRPDLTDGKLPGGELIRSAQSASRSRLHMKVALLKKQRIARIKML